MPEDPWLHFWVDHLDQVPKSEARPFASVSLDLQLGSSGPPFTCTRHPKCELQLAPARILSIEALCLEEPRHALALHSSMYSVAVLVKLLLPACAWALFMNNCDGGF